MALREFLNGYRLISFHGQSMKSRDTVDLLECLKLDVIYDFDRLEEGTPDQYSVSAKAEGFELRFDEHQVLEVIWCYIKPTRSFSAIDSGCIGVVIPESFEAAKRHAESTGHPFKVSDEAGSSAYVRVDDPKAWIHYEFFRGELSKVTIMRPWK